ncbi:interferon-inducible GTPase 5-like [Crotalus tigris]|uniref:interferon-inducible GTPase 5-like n=1 Tax=Crotalus tigris TaxID=88082 RepID=UPI00192F2976|nr:interferon-inducible GTPase 5-like [Crotalus tigris]XP_039208045.1 interferon-inducible GTPase 5-like [Crotalus tigris]
MASFPYLDEAELRNRKVQYLAQKSFAAASQIQEMLDFLNFFKVQVGILGEHRAGVSMLVEALLSKSRPVTNLAAYFRKAPQPSLSAEVHVHPTFPHLILHELPGFEATETPAAYLKKLGDLQRFSCFVIVVGTTGLRDVHLQVLKAIKQKKKPFFVVHTKIDLDLHTARRRLQYRYNPAEQLDRIRKELSETLAKDGLEAQKIFLVSGLQAERYDFACFEDTLEGEVLNLKRHHEGNLKNFPAVSQKMVKELLEICKFSTLAEVPTMIQGLLANPTQIHLNVAVIGEAGSGNSSLINALRRVGSEEKEAAPTGVAETTWRATVYPFPFVPNMYLWDLPGVGLMEDDVKRLDFSRYSVFLLVASERYKHIHSCLAKIIASEGKQSFFVRNKIDVDVEAQAGNQPNLKEKRQEQIRKSCVEALKNDGVDCPVFLVSSFMAEAYDLPLLREELQRRASELKKEALRRAIPTVFSQLVRLKSKVLMRDVWGKTLQVGLSSVDSLKETVVEKLLAVITSFCIHLGLDEISVRNTAECTGKAAHQLQAEIQSRFARPLHPTDVLNLIVKPPSWSIWAWSYVPYWGQGGKVEDPISVENIYNLLQQAVVELSSDAERLLLAAFSED